MINIIPRGYFKKPLMCYRKYRPRFKNTHIFFQCIILTNCKIPGYDIYFIKLNNFG